MSSTPDDEHLPDVYLALLKKLEPSLALESAHRALTRAFDRDVARKTDHDEALLRVLLCVRLAPMGMIRAKDVAEQMLKSTSHISRLVDRAEKKGLLERCVDPTDRRAHRLGLTDEGRLEIDTYAPHAIALWDHTLFAALSEDELTSLMEMLGKIKTAALAFAAQADRPPGP